MIMAYILSYLTAGLEVIQQGLDLTRVWDADTTRGSWVCDTMTAPPYRWSFDQRPCDSRTIKTPARTLMGSPGKLPPTLSSEACPTADSWLRVHSTSMAWWFCLPAKHLLSLFLGLLQPLLPEWPTLLVLPLYFALTFYLCLKQKLSFPPWFPAIVSWAGYRTVWSVPLYRLLPSGRN